MDFCVDVNPYLVLAMLLLLLSIIHRYMKETYTMLEKLGIPGPKPMWVFGNVQEFKGKNILKVFEDWKQKFGNVYGFYEGFRPGVVINDVDFAREILSRHFEKFYIRTSYRPFVYYPDDLRLIEIDGQHWRNQRAVVNKMLNSTCTLKQVVGKMQITSKKLIKQLENELHHTKEGQINITKHIDTYVCDGVCRFVLNMDESELTEYQTHIHNYEILSNLSASADNEIGGLARLFPSLTPLLRLGDKKHKEAHGVVVDILRRYLSIALNGQNNNKFTDDDDHSSLLSFLMTSSVLDRDIDGSLARRGLTTDEMIAHLLSLLSEIYSTTTAGIQFMLYELARNPDGQNQLYDEICNICGKNEDLVLCELQQLDYFDMFFNETYRHHPIAPGISRVCSEDCTIRKVNFRKGMVVRVMTSPMYKDETLFPQPDKFLPERFSAVNRLESHMYSFLPFGQGPRMCPGQKLAMINVKAAIINILRTYSLSTCADTEIPLKEALRPSLVPANGVCITLTRRCQD